MEDVNTLNPSLPVLPLFFNLQGRAVLLVGDGAPVDYKANLLQQCGALVQRVAAEAWTPAHFANKALAIACLEAPQAEAFVQAARAAQVPVNVIDQPQYCDFKFGTIVNRNPVVVGISTNGAAPVLGQALRTRIEAVIPPHIARWAAAAAQWRSVLVKRITSFGQRKQFWQSFVDAMFSATAHTDDPLQIADTLTSQTPLTPQGSVVLVSGGSGDPSLLTLQAVRALREADVIVHDRLISAEVIDMGRREAQRIDVGKQGHAASCAQNTISALIVELAQQGKRVVRLKGGDASIFGRAGEEIAACKAANIPVTMIAGVTSASAAAAAMCVSLTHRDAAQRLQFVTGHSRAGVLPALNFAALADPAATTCVYMPKHTAQQLAQQLHAHGLCLTTPVVLASNISRHNAQYWRGTLNDVLLGTAPMSANDPTLLMIGSSFALG